MITPSIAFGCPPFHGGDGLIGEVSTVNDDETDNIFREKVERFSTIEEDSKPLHLLVSDYDKFL